MRDLQDNQRIIILPSFQECGILLGVEAFLTDRKAAGLARGTIGFYREKLQTFMSFLQAQVIANVTDITPALIRAFMLFLEGEGHNPGGIHAAYRAIRAFLNWFENEYEPEGWKNPIAKVKAPRVAIEPLDPVSIEHVKVLLETCADDYNGARDRAILLILLDTGLRAGELLRVNLEDVDMASGAILIRQGKGRKPRMVYTGKQGRKVLRVLLKVRGVHAGALWQTREGERLTYSGLREVMRRRSNKAGIPEPALHAFRRAFALNCLRVGMDVYTLQRLMGHADLQVLRRYLAQTEGDLQAVHARTSPVDRLL
jgi:integrase/recombinase XerD